MGHHVNLAIIKALTLAQMKARYRGTMAGFLWVIMSPILLYAVQSVIFKNILRISMPHYSVFLLGGLLPWSFISSALIMGIPVLPSSRQLLLAMRISPETILVSSLMDNWINFLAAMLLLLIPVSLMGGVSPMGLLLLPVALVVLLVGTGALLATLALLNVFFRDVRFLAQFAMTLLFFITPVFYPIELIPETYRWMIAVNPIYLLIEPVRSCLFEFSLEVALRSLMKGALVAATLSTIALLYWRRKRNDFYHFL
jgi:lipopolysaccharide transport system permease protein